MKKLRAFSLAEVAVVTGVIGVLLMIAMPLFKDAKPQKEVMLMRRAYNIASTAVSELINDSSLYPDYDLGFAYRPYTYDEDDEIVYSITKAETIKRFCDNFAEKINTTEYSYNNSDKTCDITTPDGIEWTITPVFYDGSGNLKTDSTVTNGVYSSNFHVKIKNGNDVKKDFYIYMRYDGKLSVNDPDIIDVLKNPEKTKLSD